MKRSKVLLILFLFFFMGLICNVGISNIYAESEWILEKKSRDSHCDGDIDSYIEYEYDSTQNIIKESHERDGDGIIDSTYSNIYNQTGYISEIWHDYYNDAS